MNTFKTMILALMLVILSVTGVQAKERSFWQTSKGLYVLVKLFLLDEELYITIPDLIR